MAPEIASSAAVTDQQGLARMLAADIAPVRWTDLDAHEQTLVHGLIFPLDDGRAEPPTAQAEVALAFRAILFTDMVGSTEMTARLGDAEAVKVLRAHDALIRRALAAWGGREVKHMGDGFMASFSSTPPALACAAAIQRAIAEHNRSASEPIHVRVGVHAGEVVEDGLDLFGSAVQLAARLCGAAEPGGILVSGAVRLACRTAAFTDLGHRDFKGFARPVEAFALD